MANYFHVILFSLVGGVASLIGGVLLLNKQKTADSLVKYATPFAAGALLAAVFLDLLPEGIESASASQVLIAALVGIVSFFFAEHFLHWFHHHDKRSNEQIDPTVSLVIFGDTAHNVLDGIAIAAAFLVSVPTGIVTTMAVAAHEIPQEIGDFGLLLKKGMSRRSVLLVNMASALATLLAAIITFYLGKEANLPIGFMLGLSAGFLLYIALSDVVPSLHNHQDRKMFNMNASMLVLGLLIVGGLVQIAHGLEVPGNEQPTNQGIAIVCGDDEVGIDYYGNVAAQLVAIKESDCSTLPECSQQVSTEGDPINSPCLIHGNNNHEHGAAH